MENVQIRFNVCEIHDNFGGQQAGRFRQRLVGVRAAVFFLEPDQRNGRWD